MPFWAIYSLSTGGLYNVTETAPNAMQLQHDGLGASYFGEDRPDLEALEWCPKRLSFVARRGDELLAEVAGLEQRLRGEFAKRVEEDRKATNEAIRGLGVRLNVLEAGLKRLETALVGEAELRFTQVFELREELARLAEPKPGVMARMAAKFRGE